MFGAIIGIAAKVIGGGALAGGAGGIMGGGLLGSLFQGGGPLKQIFDMVSNFKGNFLGGASPQPPLGNFGRQDDAARADRRPGADRQLVDRIENLLNRLERLRGDQRAGGQDECRCGNDGFDRIRDLLRQLVGSGNDRGQATFQFTRSQYLNIQA